MAGKQSLTWQKHLPSANPITWRRKKKKTKKRRRTTCFITTTSNRGVDDMWAWQDGLDAPGGGGESDVFFPDERFFLSATCCAWQVDQSILIQIYNVLTATSKVHIYRPRGRFPLHNCFVSVLYPESFMSTEERVLISAARRRQMNV